MGRNRALEEHSYSLLGLKVGSSLAVCEQKYKELLRRYHPDRFALDDPQRELAQNRILELADALERITQWQSEAPQESFSQKAERIRNEKLQRTAVSVRIVSSCKKK